ncbi:MAG: hypothetical protein P4L85_12180 [Paludisphaera borealis]|uniref:P-type ATPase n=1 Tax=Paludisphaera borealis TaxID=1387353 RepID=UPI00284A5F92|nr:hypothetical protein [Paludisphaera borealis]MDR3620101.1 hypothetical protein [Paludisphaera borealis]
MVVDAAQSASANPSSPIDVVWSDRTLTLRDEDLFGMRASALSEQFLRRVFHVEDVRSVEVDRSQATALVHYKRGRSGAVDMLQRVATAIRSAATESTLDLIAPDPSSPKWTLHRCHDLISSWEVASERPGLARLRHAAMSADPAFAARIAHQAERLQGVLHIRRGLLTDDLTIRFDPSQTRVERLVRELEVAARASHDPDAGLTEASYKEAAAPSPVKFGAANAAIALATVSDFVLPAAWPVTAALLIGTNLRTFGQAARQVSEGRVGLPVLYTGIAAATLATNRFLPWATMSWMMRYWKHRSHEQNAAAQRGLLGEVVHRQPFARLAAGVGVEISAPVHGLGPGDVVLVGAGERIPIDGKIVRGHALVDERIVRGVSGRSRKKPDDLVHAGSIVTAGEIGVEVGAAGPGERSRATLLARATTAATRAGGHPQTQATAGQRFAERAVVPTLATAGLGLLVGGAPTALAVMRTDYASGPGHASSIENLQAIAQCVREGIVVRDPDALGRLLDVDVFLIDHHPALEATEPEIASVRVFPGHSEYQVLRFAASALHDLDDERSPALRAACEARRIPPLEGVAIEYGGDLTLRVEDQTVKVGNLGGDLPEPPTGPPERDDETDSPAAAPLDSLMVGVDGQIAGLIHFRRSSRLTAAAAIHELRGCSERSLAIGLISGRPDARLGRLADAIGIDFHEAGLSNDDVAHLIRACRKRGLTIAYVGDCVARPAAAREADLAIGLDARDLLDLDRNPAVAVFLQPDLDKLAALYDVARSQLEGMRAAQSSALLPNLFCVAGAFLLGFTSMTTVIVTNLATYSTYARNASAIRGLEHRLSQFTPRRRSRRARPDAPRTP